jgi:hypothetical protein
MAGKNAFARAAQERAWIELCGADAASCGTVPMQSRGEASLAALRLALHGWAFRTSGLDVKPVIYIQQGTHDSIEKAVRFLFWKDEPARLRPAIHLVPRTEAGAIDAAEFDSLVARDRARGYSPVIAVGTFGTDREGAADPLREMAATCRRNEIWFHVDAAKNGGLLAHPAIAASCRPGFAAADSVALPGLFLTRYAARLEKCGGEASCPAAEFNRAAAHFMKHLEKQAIRELESPARKRFRARLGL